MRVGPLVAALVLVAAGCSTVRTTEQGAVPDPGTTVEPPTTAAITTISSIGSTGSTGSIRTSGSTTAAVAEPAGEPGFECRRADLDSGGSVQRTELTEASGLVASRNHPGVLWAHNDSADAGSGRNTGVYGFDLAGQDRGFFELIGPDGPITGTDVEDIALSGNTVYLADIGDNLRARDHVQIYVFDEPQPGPDGSVPVGSIITARYPDGPTDAETLLVDEAAQRLVILSKDLDDTTAPTRIYSLPIPAAGVGAEGPAAGGAVSDDPIEMRFDAAIDVAALTRSSSTFSLGGLAFPGAVTGGDVSEDGSLVVLRTYASVWLFIREPGRSVADAMTGPACEIGAASEAQGEAVALLPADGDGTIRHVTVSEGPNPAVNLGTLPG